MPEPDEDRSECFFRGCVEIGEHEIEFADAEIALCSRHAAVLAKGLAPNFDFEDVCDFSEVELPN